MSSLTPSERKRGLSYGLIGALLGLVMLINENGWSSLEPFGEVFMFFIIAFALGLLIQHIKDRRRINQRH